MTFYPEDGTIPAPRRFSTQQDREQDERLRSIGAVDLDPARREAVPVLGNRNRFEAAADWANHEDHIIANLRYQLEQQRKQTVHFKVSADDWERNYRSVQQTAQNNLLALNKLREATGGVVPEFQIQGNFTICVLVDPVSERVFTGAACCNVEDTFSEEIGKAISLGRAMQSRAEFFAKAAFARG